ncbi:Uncharacterised protein [Mycobacteroides abscessus subsp. abscessus]|nr:Uncharacterised protein [Mycobacteroides abscessus subsp. abscessus]
MAWGAFAENPSTRQQRQMMMNSAARFTRNQMTFAAPNVTKPNGAKSIAANGV